MTLKEKLIEYLEANRHKDYRIRYYPVSPYMKKRYKPEYWQEECWLYPKEVVKRQRQVFKKGQTYNVVDANGNPVMESESGICITEEIFNDKEYLKDYLNI
jgi:hypothetical protein